MKDLKELESQIPKCRRCPRLIDHCRQIAQTKRRSFQDQTYWGKPVPGFGDPKARILIVGLAPAAHGANRTGRMFTGDRSGLWLYRALHRAGFSNQETSDHRSDSLKLQDVYITAIAHCAPPQNRPLPEEIQNCSRYLQEDLKLLPNLQVIIALGGIALKGIWPFLETNTKKPKFGHLVQTTLNEQQSLILSYHPSQQNTFTGRLTEPMFDSVFQEARKLVF